MKDVGFGLLLTLAMVLMVPAAATADIFLLESGGRKFVAIVILF